MASPVNPLDFEAIISYAIGSGPIFIYIAVIALSIVAARIRMPMSAYFLMMFMFLLIMYYTLGYTIAILISVITAIIIGFIIMRLIK